MLLVLPRYFQLNHSNKDKRMNKYDHGRANVLGVGVSTLNMSAAIDLVYSFLETGKKGYICATGVHGIMEAQEDPSFREIQNGSFITTPDGMPTVWIGHLQGYKKMEQISGPDFMLKACEVAAHNGTKHFLYGGKPGVAEKLKDALVKRFPGLNIVGTYTPPFRPLNEAEEVELFNKVRESGAEIIWCGISTPKQERFMAQYLHLLPVKLMIGVGAAFDINCGLVADAPQWVKKIGMQWLHRLYQEPRRLWRRYLFNNPRFLLLFFLQWLGLRRYEIGDSASSSIPHEVKLIHSSES